ncbi:MAG: redoxin domain-containing protein [Parasphingorhabdus sp.]|nr:redoxin domain-containing protein [Parasphingorhabdus sp.]
MKPSLAILALGLAATPLCAAQKTGAIAQDFKLTNAAGKTVQLSDYRGRTVVLEWHNPGCPFVQKHYVSGNMQATQAKARTEGAVWLTINSGAPGKQGYLANGKDVQALVTAQAAKPTEYLRDPQGIVGKAYAARTTPQMAVIDKDGIIVYQGGIDDKPTADTADVPGARNFVLAALADMKAGRAVRVAESRPYGCSVKYAE